MYVNGEGYLRFMRLESSKIILDEYLSTGQRPDGITVFII